MKNKKLTYLLGVIVLAIWGMIVYRVFVAVKGNDDDHVPTGQVTASREPYNDYSIPRDTTHLLLNYRDPFGLVKFKDTAELVVKASRISRVVPIPKPAINWTFIQYAGYIRNPGSKKLIALVNINGKNEMLKEGETKEQVKLIKNMRDSIKISYNGQIKCIPIKSVAL